MKFVPTIALGSGLGGALRYAVDLVSIQAGAGTFPAGTLLANVTGSLLIGWLAGRWATGGALAPHPGRWHFWMTGFCGGYTTFSAFAWQALDMIRQGEAQAAGFYAAASIGLGMIAVWVGLSIGVRGRGDCVGGDTE